ncbi:MAG: FAD-binding protein, partial [Gammaproteobacteria bacterium]
SVKPRRRSGGALHVAIIGSGGAAFACAIRAAEEGAEVTLIEREARRVMRCRSVASPRCRIPRT